MITLVAYYRLWLLIAFLIGLATAWWTWGRKARAGDKGRRRPSPPPSVRKAPDNTQAAPSPPQAVSAAEAGEDAVATPAEEARTMELPPQGDDLTRINCVDARMAGMLNLLGVRRYDEIAGWTDADVEKMTVLLGAGAGRIAEQKWIEQAWLLAEGNGEDIDRRLGLA